MLILSVVRRTRLKREIAWRMRWFREKPLLPWQNIRTWKWIPFHLQRMDALVFSFFLSILRRLSATLNNSLYVRADIAHRLTDKYLRWRWRDERSQLICKPMCSDLVRVTRWGGPVYWTSASASLFSRQSSGEDQWHIQCSRKVFRALDFFHILLLYCLILKWMK